MKFIDIHSHHVNEQAENEVKVLSYYQNLVKEPSHFFTIGQHPWFLNEHIDEKWFSHPRCVAVGECGLDKIRSRFPLVQQIQVFEQHLMMADRLKKPVVLHVVRAYEELQKMLKQYDHLVYIWHGFNGNYEIFKQFERFDIFFSFGVRNAKNLGWKQIPVDRVLMETDDSALSIKEVYLLYAQTTGYSIDEIVEKVYQNAKRVLEERI